MNITEENKTQNSTAEVKGYKPQSPETIALVNKFKEHEKQLGILCKEANATGLADARMIAIGKTNAQQAYMWLNRSIFQPEDYFQI